MIKSHELASVLVGLLAIFGVLYLLHVVDVCNFQCDTGEDPGTPAYYR